MRHSLSGSRIRPFVSRIGLFALVAGFAAGCAGGSRSAEGGPLAADLAAKAAPVGTEAGWGRTAGSADELPELFGAGNMEELADWMTGSFSSAAQAEADSAFFDIRLEMVRIWPERDDAIWLYIEQAAAWALDEPYRQRVYRLTEEAPGSYRSTVLELPDPEAMVGAYGDPSRFSALRPDDLGLREGCHIDLRSENGVYVGSTDGKSCLSTLRGASYATSEVRITRGGILSWDRGWDARDEQVWGAVKSGYDFVKIADY